MNGEFTNLVGGAATNWIGSTLNLVKSGGGSYTINTKSAGDDTYNILTIGTNTDIRMWTSSANTYSVDSSGSLYSMDHNNSNGSLYIWGDYHIGSGQTEHWSRATDFDGASLVGSERQCDVRFATSTFTTTTLETGGQLQIIGASSATTTLDVQGSSGTYALLVSGGTINADYYQIRSISSSGLNLSGTPTVTSLDHGDFVLESNGGAMINVSSSTIDQNPALTITGCGFSTSSGITSGYNVKRNGTSSSFWTLTGHYGNYDGESYDYDPGGDCGKIRWDDSTCLILSELHYRWRNDNGKELLGDWSYRKSIAIYNATSTTLTDYQVEVTVGYNTSTDVDVNCEAHSQTDFDDIRFTNSGEDVLLSHFRESYTASASSTFWVKIPSLTGSATTTIYIYYGNSSASSASNGKDALFIYEDMTATPDGTLYGNASYIAASDWVRLTAASGSQSGQLYYTQNPGSGFHAKFRFWSGGGTGADAIWMGAYNTTEVGETEDVVHGGYHFTFDEYESRICFTTSTVDNGVGLSCATGETGLDNSTWHDAEVYFWEDSSGANADIYLDGTIKVNHTETAVQSLSGNYFSWGGRTGGSTNEHRIDDLIVVKYASPGPSVQTVSNEQSGGGATWRVAEDVSTNISKDTNIRVRFSIENSGTLTNYNYRLQVAEKGGSVSCEAVADGSFSDVTTSTAQAAIMATSSYFVGDPEASQASTTQQLSDAPGSIFVTGKMVEANTNQSAVISLASDRFTEVEYNIKFTSNATGSIYCFRATNSGTALDSYSKVATIELFQGPVVDSLFLNGGENIVLLESSTNTVVATGTVSDLNGHANITNVIAKIYRSGVSGTESCGLNNNNCYETTCATSSCSGDSCHITCSFNVWYYADPTDGTIGESNETPWSGEYWEAWAKATDAEANTGSATNTTQTIDTISLLALDVLPAINYGDNMKPGDKNDPLNSTTSVIATGNCSLDLGLYGTAMVAGVHSIGVGQQRYATSGAAYSSGAVLSGTEAPMDLNLSKTVTSTSPSTDNVWWGIEIPVPQSIGSYEGANTFIGKKNQIPW